MFLKFFQKLDDSLSYLLSSTGSEHKLLKNIFKKKKIILVDIGSNEGNYVELINKHLNLKLAYCIEPIQSLTDKINQSFPGNKIKILNFALSNRRGKKNFYEYNISSTSSLYKQNNLYKSLKNLKKISKVQLEKFDDIFNKNLKIDICKIDAQGEDYNVLKGMRKNLKKKNIKILKIELSLESFYLNTKKNFYEIIFYLKKFNYEIISISKIKYKNDRITFIDAYFEYKK